MTFLNGIQSIFPFCIFTKPQESILPLGQTRNIPFTSPDASPPLNDRHIASVDLSDLIEKTKQHAQFQWDSYKTNLLQALETGQCKTEIETVLKSLTLEHFENFINHLIDWIHEGNPHNLHERIIDLIPEDKLVDLGNEKYPHVDLSDRIKRYSNPSISQIQSPTDQHPINTQKQQFDPKSRNVITRFIPNFFSFMGRFFDYFGPEHTPGTLLEYYSILLLYLKFSELPFDTFRGFNYFTNNPATSLLCTTLLWGISLAAAYMYLRWLKPRPTIVDWTENLSQKIRTGELQPPPVLYRDEVVDYFRSVFADSTQTARAIFIGEPGTGKTNMAEYLAVLHPKKEVFRFKILEMLDQGLSFQSMSGKISQAFLQTQDHRREVVFCFDELGKAYEANPHAITGLLHSLKGQGIHFVGAMTIKQWNAFNKADSEIGQKIKTLYFDPTTEDQTLELLQLHIQRTASRIFVEEKDLGKVIELTNTLQGRAQPRAAIDFLDELILKINHFKPESYTSPALHAAKNTLRKWENQKHLMDDPDSEQALQYMIDVANAETTLEQEMTKNSNLKIEAEKMLRYLDQQRHCFHLRKEAASKLADGKDTIRASNHLKKQFIYSYYFALQSLKKKIDAISSKLNADMFIRLDARTIQSAFEPFKKKSVVS